jgi:hypothetical protein
MIDTLDVCGLVWDSSGQVKYVDAKAHGGNVWGRCFTTHIFPHDGGSA